jgi:alpha-tubulin suppressor-like RCC1 family protein
MDVLSASAHDDKIAWYENTDGQGTFSTQKTITTQADYATSVHAADIDGDGDMDVLSASAHDDKIAWYENTDGQGTFSTQKTITTQADYATSVHAADIDGDGDMDVLSASANDNKIAWYENTDGQGTFSTQKTITTQADYALSVYAADIDGDGDMDVLSASANDNEIAWYENTDGQGTFSTQKTITNQTNGATSVYAADIDGDGDMDVLSASWNDDKIAWYENTDGQGTFSTQKTITTQADSAFSVYAADIDGDGNIDVLSASRNDDKIAWYENTMSTTYSYDSRCSSTADCEATCGADTGCDGYSERKVFAQQLSLGGSHTCSLFNNGQVKCWGSGGFGKLGYGDTENRGDGANEMGTNLSFVNLGSGKTAKQVIAGGYHTCAILNDDTVKCWGSGQFAQLGYGDTDIRGDGPNEMGNNLTTVDLGTGKTAKQLVAGGYHTCAILNDDTVKCWGLGGNGRLGYGDTDIRGDGPNEMGNNLPIVDLGTDKTAKQLVAGGWHTCAILNDDTVKCWGWGGNGRLGYGDTEDRGDQANEMGNNLPIVDLGTDKTAKQLVAGDWHTCAILNDDTIKCWGYSTYGQLGYGDTDSRGDSPNEMGNHLPVVDLGTDKTAKQLAAGSAHTCAILNDDTIKCWGYGNHGQLGYGDKEDRGNQANEMGNNLPIVDLGTDKTAKQLVAGEYHTCATLNDDTVKCWGRGDHGRLGYGDTSDRGWNTNTMVNNLPAVDLGLPAPVFTYGSVHRTETTPVAQQLSLGEEHSCSLGSNGLVKCWGRGDDGRLGYGDTENRGDQANEMAGNLAFVDLGTGKSAKQISVGGTYTCALLNDDTVKCWGNGNNGYTGYGDQSDRGDGPNEMGDNLATIDLGTDKTAKQIFAGRYHTCAILNDDTLKCWGSGNRGQLGYGDTTTRGDQASEMGDNLGAVDLGTDKKAKQLAIGELHTCAILNDDTVKCWGRGSDGQLGYGDLLDRGDSGASATTCNDGKEMGDCLPTVNLGTGKTAKQISAGSYHTCAILKDDNTVKCWGYGENGRLGYGDTTTRSSPPTATVNLGTGKTAKQISAGPSHTCAILDDDTVKCWGTGSLGRLGYGDENHRGDGANEMGDNLPVVDLGSGKKAKQINLGNIHTCAILNDDSVKCWGRGNRGQLGYGDINDRGDGANEMGNNLAAVDIFAPTYDYDLINGITGSYKIVSRNYSYGQETAASGGLSQTKVCPSSHKYGVYSIAYEPSCTTSDLKACLAITTDRTMCLEQGCADGSTKNKATCEAAGELYDSSTAENVFYHTEPITSEADCHGEHTWGYKKFNIRI